MIRTVSLAILLLVPQDDLEKRITQILPRLSDDSIEVRDQAVKDLADLGAAALPLLKQRAEKQQGETKGLLLAACRLIESRDTLGKVLPPLKKVTLEAFNKPVRDTQEEISRQTGIAMEFSNGAPEGTVTLSLKEATPLQAADEFCRKAGLTWRGADDEMGLMMRRKGAGIPVVTKGPRLLLQPGKPPEYPSSYVRHYKLRVTQVSMTRTNNFQGIQSNAQLMLDVQWSPDVRPDGMHSFQVSEIKDDQGRSLLPDPGPRNRFRHTHRRAYRNYNLSYPQNVTLKFPEADAKSIAVIQGTMTLTFPKDVKTLKFEKPAEAKGKTLEMSGLKITLKDYQDKGTSHRVSVMISGKAEGEARGEDDMDSGYPFNYDDIELVTETGEVMDNRGMSGTGDGQSYTWDLDYEAEKPTAIKEIRITCVLSRHMDEVKFELRDITLPR